MQKLPQKFKLTKTKGKGRGEELGIPTINFTIPENLDLPYGVYAGWFYNNTQKYQAAIHFGPRPTFNEKDPSLEAYILSGNIEITQDSFMLEFVKLIRDEKTFHFNSESEMLARIAKDVEEIKKVLNTGF